MTSYALYDKVHATVNKGGARAARGRGRRARDRAGAPSLDTLLAFAPADLLRVPELSVDRRVLLYAVGLSVLTGLIVGLVPAVLVAPRSLVASLRTGGSNMTQSPRVRQALAASRLDPARVLRE